MKHALESATITLVLALLVGVGFASSGEFQQPQEAENLEWEATVHAEMYDDQGDLVWEDTQENTLTYEGENYFRSLAIGEVSNNINYIALSNSTNYQKNKDHNYLQGEVTCCNLTRQEAAIQKIDDGEWSLQAVWTAGGAVDGVKAAGLFPHDVQSGDTTSDDNILVAEATMAEKTFREDYRFELEWNIQLSS